MPTLTLPNQLEHILSCKHVALHGKLLEIDRGDLSALLHRSVALDREECTNVMLNARPISWAIFFRIDL